MAAIPKEILRLTSSKNNTLKLSFPIIHANSSDMSAFDNEIIETIKPRLVLNDKNTAEFWGYMTRLAYTWGDANENNGTSAYVIRRNIANIDNTRTLFIYLREYMYVLMDDLDEKITKSKIEKYLMLEPNEKKKVLSHIIGKGKDFYDNVIAEHSFVGYIITMKSYRDFREVFLSNNIY